MAEQTWKLRGTVVVACNCDYGCPCNFNAYPTKGKCEGGWTWHVEEGNFGDLRLDGLNFSLYCNWPGAIHEGNGEALALVDERAEEAQREAFMTLVKGEVGGPWGVLGWTWPTLHGPIPVPYELELNGTNSSIKGGDLLELELEPIRNPVTGAEIHPSLVLPEGMIHKEASVGASKLFRLRDGVSYDHTGQHTALGPFEYRGP
jgi:hypothetical protein